MTEAGQQHVAALRRHYRLAGLDEHDLAPDPMSQFASWFQTALESMDEVGLPEPNAMVVATADPSGRPSTRMVLLKAYDARGFVFYTNYGSRKATELAANPQVSLHFPWLVLQRQVVVVGTAEKVPRAETEAYFASRPRGSQLGAWASRQSSVVSGRTDLEQAYAEAARRFPDGRPVPAPEHWGGFRVVPESVEFWQGRPDRMHDRLRYRRSGDGWIVERLSP